MRQVVIYPGEDDYWVAEVPSIPGCISQGKTREEAITNIKKAINAYSNALKRMAFPSQKNALRLYWRLYE